MRGTPGTGKSFSFVKLIQVPIQSDNTREKIVSDIGLYTNRNRHRDFVRNAIEHLSSDGCNVYIAVAFFTEISVIEKLLVNGCRVRLVVRLGFPTNPNALEKLKEREGVEIRYFTGHSFHPKIYIFCDKEALIGSANLTDKAINSNQEVVVSIRFSDVRFTEIQSLFEEYWSEARVLDSVALDTYKTQYKEYAKLQASIEKHSQNILSKLGTTQPSDIIVRDKVKASQESLFLEDFKKTYQECTTAFKIVREAYESTGYRKVAPTQLPLRLEIDSFISYIRDRIATGDKWKEGPLRSAADQRPIIVEMVNEWRNIKYLHLEDEIVGENYPRLLRTFESEETLKASTDDELFGALGTLHSFYDRLRFFKGGTLGWKQTFLAANDGKRVRETLAYLVFGRGSIENRMANVIYNPAYKLNEFGKSNVQELIGWCNREELPVINGRTTKILRFFGSDVRQLG
jgi:HKD family nuclease